MWLAISRKHTTWGLKHNHTALFRAHTPGRQTSASVSPAVLNSSALLSFGELERQLPLPHPPQLGSRALTCVRTKRQHHTMGSSNLAHPEGPAPGAAGPRAQDCLSRVGHALPEGPPPRHLGCMTGSDRGSSVTSVRGPEPHQPGAPHLRQFPRLPLCLLASGHTRNSAWRKQ